MFVCFVTLFCFCVSVLFPCVTDKSGFYWINDGLVTSEGKMQPWICSRGNLKVDTAEKENVGRNLATLDRNMDGGPKLKKKLFVMKSGLEPASLSNIARFQQN